MFNKWYFEEITWCSGILVLVKWFTGLLTKFVEDLRFTRKISQSESSLSCGRTELKPMVQSLECLSYDLLNCIEAYSLLEDLWKQLAWDPLLHFPQSCIKGIWIQKMSLMSLNTFNIKVQIQYLHHFPLKNHRPAKSKMIKLRNQKMFEMPENHAQCVLSVIRNLNFVSRNQFLHQFQEFEKSWSRYMDYSHLLWFHTASFAFELLPLYHLPAQTFVL